MRYTPFDVDLNEVSESHLVGLQEVAEGWYVEYKSEVPKQRDVAKSLSSFANRYGGWYFLGVQEDPTDNTAAAFPGIADSEVTAVVQRIRDAAKDSLQPTVPFLHSVITGPLSQICLEEGRSIIVVRVHEGASPPYMHNDGRVYVRTGDSSSPVPVTDRATLDLLHRKAEQKASILDNLVYRRPEVSKGEGDTPYLHLVISSDPFEVLGHWYAGSFQHFAEIMTDQPLPFDNMFTSQDGFVARQALNNKRYNRLFTWEFSRACNSFITLPLGTLPHPNIGTSRYLASEWEEFAWGERFGAVLAEREMDAAAILNLNLLVTLLPNILAKHRLLVRRADVGGPFYLKAILENTWRIVPFIDLESYISHIESFDVPIVQDSEVTAPMGGWPSGFVIAPEIEVSDIETAIGKDGSAVDMWLAIMQSLGVPADGFGAGKEILLAAQEETARHLERIPGLAE